MRSSSHELSHVRQAKRASIYRAFAGSVFRMEGVKSIINDRKISGSVRGENTSMLIYWGDGVFPTVRDTMDMDVRGISHQEGFFPFTFVLIRL